MLVNEFYHGHLEYKVQYMVYGWGTKSFSRQSPNCTMKGAGMTPWELVPNNLVNAYHYDHQENMWFLGGNLDHFQDNLPVV